MKNLLAKLLVALLICALMFTVVSCNLFNSETPNGNENIGNENGGNDSTDGENTGNSIDKSALEAELALEITEQGDYTDDSYDAYLAKLQAAKNVAADENATQENINNAAAELTAARLALAVRSVYEVEGGNKSFRMISGNVKEIALADYVDENGLSKISYSVKTSNAVVELSQIADGKFTITAGEVLKETDVKISIIVSYDGAEKLTVDLSVKITNDKAPVLVNAEVNKDYDLFDLVNKESLVIDFAENVDNAGNLALDYSVMLGDTELALDGTCYTLALGSYGEDTV